MLGSSRASQPWVQEEEARENGGMAGWMDRKPCFTSLFWDESPKQRLNKWLEIYFTVGWQTDRSPDNLSYSYAVISLNYSSKKNKKQESWIGMKKCCLKQKHLTRQINNLLTFFYFLFHLFDQFELGPSHAQLNDSQLKYRQTSLCVCGKLSKIIKQK